MKVRCIVNGFEYIIKDKVYDVVKIGESNYSVIANNGKQLSYSKCNFEIVEEETQKPKMVRCVNSVGWANLTFGKIYEVITEKHSPNGHHFYNIKIDTGEEYEFLTK